MTVKMERLSNSYEELQKAAKRELENFSLKTGEKVIAYFSEFPSIAGFPFKIVLVENAEGAIYSSFRQWDTEYDFTRWSNGIYNLDRLRIITDRKFLSPSDTTCVKIWLMDMWRIELPETLQNDKAIVLDGADWTFGFHSDNLEVEYKWRAANADIELFVPWIELMKAQHVGINRRE